MSSRQVVWEILVPRKSNGGRAFHLEYHRKWDEKVRAIAGGLTIFSATKKGVWTSGEGVVFSESMIPVRISCSRKQIKKIMAFTAKHYLQKAIMAYKVSEEVLIRKYR